MQKSAYQTVSLSSFYAFMLITEMLYLFVKINIDTTVLVIVIAFRGVSCQQITLWLDHTYYHKMWI